MRGRAAGGAVAVGGIVLAAFAAAQPQADAIAFLRKHAGFSNSDIAALGRGEAVSRSLGATNKREVAVFGAVSLAVPKAYYLQRFRDIERFKRGEMVLAIRRFSDPPRLEDLDALTLEREDVAALAKCRVGDCDVQLDADAIERFRREVNWRAADAPDRATRLFREILLATVEAYRIWGDSALGPYRDRGRAVDRGAEFRGLLAASPYLLEYGPALREHLDRYPAVRPETAEDFFYWSKERFGFKPVISITHVTIVNGTAGGPDGRYLMSSKQIYASHYFDASLALTALADAPPTAAGAEPCDEFWLMYLNRSRSSTFGGLFGGFARSAAQGRTRDGMISNLRQIKARLEREHAAGTR